MKRLANKPFALIGVNSDRDKDKLRARMQEENITWRSFWCGELGTSGWIPTTWNVRGWPTIYVLDHEGKIRFKGARGHKMDEAVNELLTEMGVDLGDTLYSEGAPKPEPKAAPKGGKVKKLRRLR